MSYITDTNYCPICGGRMYHGSGICFTCGYEETQLPSAPQRRRAATKRTGQRKLKYGCK